MRKIYLVLLAVLFLANAKSQSTTLVISQVYGGGQSGGATYNADFVELHNVSNGAINLSGKSIQYAAAGTTGTWSGVFALPSVSIPAGGYYLIRMSATGTGAALPTPDATASPSIGMSATSGRVALVNGTSAISACPATVIDLAGYGTSICFEGAAATAALTTTSAAFRALNGCQDTDQNGTDFSTATPAPRNSASPVNLCAISCTTPSGKATDMRYGGSGTNSMTVYFTRGNGTGSLVICRQGAAVNVVPPSGTVYTANSVFGSGSDLGGGNYAVFNTTFKGVNAFTVTGLTAGTKYYFSVFEYNDPGKCYTATGLVDSFTVGSNILHTGDMAFIGWDNNAVTGGEDRLYIMNMVDINKGTRFSLVNSRFESGAAANNRTNRWYSGGDDPFQNPYCFEFEYAGASPIAKGSVISMESNSVSGFTGFSINGTSVPSGNFTVISAGVNSNFLSTAGGDQVYIVQGRFTPYGTAGTDRYNLLNGVVLHGFTTGLPWVPLTSAVSAATGGTGRESRIPPDILCTALQFPLAGDAYGVYKRSAGTAGTKNELLSTVKNTSANWTTGTGTAGVNDAPLSEPNINNPFTINNSPNADGDWTGATSSDWFDCNNWESLHVPDSTTDAGVGQGLPFFAQINITTSPYAVQYSNIARAGSVTVANNGNGSLSLLGSGNEKLVVEKNLTVSLWGSLVFENNTNALNDSICVHGSFNSSQPVNGFIKGMGTIVMDEARTNVTPNQVQLFTGTSGIYNLVMNNTRSVDIALPLTVTNNLNLQNGYLNTSTTGTLTLSSTAGITSPANVYGQSNKGWFNSFVNGKMYYDADASSVNMVFPIGKYSTTDTAYAPAELTKTNTTACTYDAEYFPVAYSDLSVDIAQLHHVSKLEHWLINSTVTSADAKVTLSWRPRSQVGDGTTSLPPLDSLMVGHYFDDDGPGGNASLWHVDGGSNIIMPKNSGYSTSYGLITTLASTGSFSPFTLGSRGTYNILPVKLLAFNGYRNNGPVHLQWITAEEQFVDRYEIEKSTDGNHFSRIGTVNSLNISNRYTYNSLDPNPVTGWNYYRLKVIDKNGKPSYSLIIKVWGGANQLLVYPNPARDELKINLPSTSSISIIQVVNMSGQVAKQLATPDQSLTINVGSLSNGLYIVKVITDRQTISQRFTKQ